MRAKGLFLAGAALLTAGCNVSVNNGADDETENNSAPAEQAQPQPQLSPSQQQMRDSARQELQNLRFEVDISDKKLRLFNGDQAMREHDVAVGTSEWPTPTGSWKIHRVDLNPEWIPPKDEKWAKDETKKAAGDPENPMGRARLVYRMPNTIHGTDEKDSLGKRSSHGSIRVSNEVVLQLAEMLLKAGGAWDGPERFQQMTQNRTKEEQIDLPNAVPIVVKE